MLPCFTYGCAHTCCWAWGFLCFLAVLCPPSGSGSTGSSGYSSPLGFPTFAMGSPLRGRGLFVLDRNEGLVSPFWVRYTGQFMVGPHASVCGVPARPVPQGVLPGGPRCVRELRLFLAPSSVLHCPMLGFSVASTTLAVGMGVVLGTLPYFLPARVLYLGRWLGLCPAAAGALLPGGPH